MNAAAWIIDRDYLNEPGDEYNRVGYGEGEIPTGATTYRFRLRDEDGEVHFGGRYTAEAITEDVEGGDTELLYDALGFGIADTGACILEVKAADYQQLVGISPRIADWFESVTKDGWYIPDA